MFRVGLCWDVFFRRIINYMYNEIELCFKLLHVRMRPYKKRSSGNSPFAYNAIGPLRLNVRMSTCRKLNCSTGFVLELGTFYIKSFYTIQAYFIGRISGCRKRNKSERVITAGQFINVIN